MDIHKILDEKIKTASNADRSRINRVMSLLRADTDVLRNNYSHHLYSLYLRFYREKLTDERKNYNDESLASYVANKCVTRLREIKEMKDGH